MFNFVRIYSGVSKAFDFNATTSFPAIFKTKKGCVFHFKLSARSQIIKSLYDLKRTEFAWIPIDRKKPLYFNGFV